MSTASTAVKEVPSAAKRILFAAAGAAVTGAADRYTPNVPMLPAWAKSLTIGLVAGVGAVFTKKSWLSDMLIGGSIITGAKGVVGGVAALAEKIPALNAATTYLPSINGVGLFDGGNPFADQFMGNTEEPVAVADDANANDFV
jgi:hypothetical protein